MRTAISYRLSAISFIVLLTGAVPAFAQESADETRPAFSLSTSEVFTTRDAPNFYLTFKRVTHLDFRVYKVRDPFAFFEGLNDPHQVGTGETYVKQERTWLERFSDWKRGQRQYLRRLARAQASHEYRAARRAENDEVEVSQRVVLNASTFAQVPLLNADQVVTTWRELLPNRTDPEVRRVPVNLKQPGIYVVEAVNDLLRAYTIVIVSDIGLVTKTSPGQMLFFAANRFTGEPVNDCNIHVVYAKQTIAEGRTNADGLFEAKLPDQRMENLIGVAQCGDQHAATDPGSWTLEQPARELAAYVYTDKPIYRPGHTVHMKAVLRWKQDDAITRFDRPDAEIVVSDTNDKTVFRRQVKLDSFGAIQAAFAVPSTAALGLYTIKVQSGDAIGTGGFEVQEYRKPEFEVIVTTPNRFVVQGNEAIVNIQARYYFGQPVANGQLRWVVNQQPYYSPFRWNDDVEDGDSDYFYGDNQTAEGTLRLDADGKAQIRVPLAIDENQRDFSARIEAQVTDAASREVVGRTIVHATYGSFLLSAETTDMVHRAGSNAAINVRALDYLGNAQANVPLTVRLEHLQYRSGYYNEPEVTTLATQTATTDATGRASVTFTVPNRSGSFRVRATAPSGDRTVQDDVFLWVSGPNDSSDNGDRYLELLSDKKSYAPGESATLIVRGETVVGPVLVTKEGQHVSWYRVLRPSATDTLQVPIDEGDVGDVFVNLVYVREGRLFRAERRLGVPATSRTLQVSVTAQQAVSKPRDPGIFEVAVTDAAGQPVRAQVSLAVIDEAVYGVKPDNTPDPVRFFYRRDYARVSTTFSSYYYFMGFSGTDRLQLAQRKRRPFTLADFKGDQPTQAQVRKEFPDAIHWVGDLVTDAQGRGRVTVNYPDALTTWRLTARAITEDTKAGSTIARTTTTKDLIVRIITPRFLTEGDEVVVPTLVHNYKQEARTASVSIESKGLDAVGAQAPTTGSLASGAERRDDWRFAAKATGSATVTATAKTESDVDAVELPIPVLPFGMRREIGTSGSIVGTGEATATVKMPETSNPASRTVAISLAPSIAGSVLGALDSLTDYPYGCTEQTVSSFLPNLVVTRALTELKLAPTERLSALDRQVSAGVRRLYDYQNTDGGWGWWKGEDNHPFMTAYALWGLDESRRAGVKIDEERIGNAARQLAHLYAQYPRVEPDLKAYEAYVLQRAAGTDNEIEWFDDDQQGRYSHAAARDELWNMRGRMSAYGRALLLLLLDETKDQRGDQLAAALIGEAQTRGDVSWWTVPNDPLIFDYAETSVEATAFAVQALVKRDPKNPLVERAVRWMMLNRTSGYWWSSTKQTAMAIYGLLAFMQARQETAQPFSVDVFVNGKPAGQHSFTAAEMMSSDPIVFTAPANVGDNQVRITKRDGGSVYWSTAAVYYDTAHLDARQGSRQLAITRKYALLTPVTVKGKIVYRETAFSGTANPGDVLTVRITAAGSPEWRYLVLEDPLPAGVEAIQDTSSYPLEDDPPDLWWTGTKVEYRDSRTVFFQDTFESGRYEFTYLVKVISPGQFRAVPAQISPMYVPNVHASSEPQAFTFAAGGSR